MRPSKAVGFSIKSSVSVILHPCFSFHFPSLMPSLLAAVNADPGSPFLKPLDGSQGVAGLWASLGLYCGERWSCCISVDYTLGLGVRLVGVPALPPARWAGFSSVK